MFNKKELIIFDLDGTLIDSAPDLAMAVNFMLKKLKRKSFSEDMIREWIGNGASVLVKRALCGKKEYSEIDENQFKEALDIFLDYYGKNLTYKTYLYPNVKDTLNYLKDKDYLLAIATNKPTKFIAPILKHFSIDSYFDIALGADSVINRKPHPEMLINIYNHFSIKKEHTLMVGDSINDKLAAKNADVDFLGVSYGYSDVDIGPNVVEDFKKIGELL